MTTHRAPCWARRSGVTLAELAATIAIAGVLGAALASIMVAQQRIARAQAERADVAETLRAPALILGAELRAIDPGADIAALGDDSLRLRVFRASGIACAAERDWTLVRYRGIREPDPAKDSVLALAAGEPERVLPVLAVAGAAGECDSGVQERLERWRLGTPVPPGSPVLLFETGTYHLSAEAFRYQRGPSGRQPLTPELLDLSSSRFAWIAADSAPVPDPASAPAVEIVLAPHDGRAGGRASRSRIAFLNRESR